MLFSCNHSNVCEVDLQRIPKCSFCAAFPLCVSARLRHERRRGQEETRWPTTIAVYHYAFIYHRACAAHLSFGGVNLSPVPRIREIVLQPKLTSPESVAYPNSRFRDIDGLKVGFRAFQHRYWFCEPHYITVYRALSVSVLHGPEAVKYTVVVVGMPSAPSVIFRYSPAHL